MHTPGGGGATTGGAKVVMRSVGRLAYCANAASRSVSSESCRRMGFVSTGA